MFLSLRGSRGTPITTNFTFWKCNFPINHNVCLSVGLSVCRSVRIFLMSEFYLNVAFFYFFLETLPLPSLKCSQHVHNRLHDMFTTCWQHVDNMFMTSSRHVHGMFTTCSRHVHGMFTTCSQHVDNNVDDMFTTWSRHVHNLFTTCSRHVHDTFTACSWHIHDMFTTCSRHVHGMFMTCSWHVCVMFATYSREKLNTTKDRLNDYFNVGTLKQTVQKT